MALACTTRATHPIFRRVLTRTNHFRLIQTQAADIDGCTDSLHRLGEIAVDCPTLIPRVVSKLSAGAREELELIINKEIIASDKDSVTNTQLLRLAVWYGTPMIGFGFCDNAIMIIAGDYIDSSLCLALGYGTMFAAALGNLISDVAGVALGGAIENIGNKLGLKHHQISPKQLQTRTCLIVKYSGIGLGIAFGCILGMFPLLWPEEYRMWGKSKRLERRKASEEAPTQQAAGLL